MLKKAHISPIRMHNKEWLYKEEWKRARVGKFTSSKMHYLTYPTGLTEGSINYIRQKVGEELTGVSADKEIDTEATRWGLMHEEAAIRKWGVKMGLEFVIVQQLITDPDSRFGSTPDALILIRESPDKTEYEVETLEAKCPPTFDAYIGLFECDRPVQLKKENRIYYWQVIDQMDQAGAKRGHFVIYHPDFKAGNHKSMVFDPLEPEVDVLGRKTFPIYEDLKLLRIRKKQALVEFDRIRKKLISVPAM